MRKMEEQQRELERKAQEAQQAEATAEQKEKEAERLAQQAQSEVKQQKKSNMLGALKSAAGEIKQQQVQAQVQASAQMNSIEVEQMKQVRFDLLHINFIEVEQVKLGCPHLRVVRLILEVRREDLCIMQYFRTYLFIQQDH